MNRIRTSFAIAVIAIAAGLAVGCGDDEGEESTGEDPQTVLDQTFQNEEQVSSGNLNLSFSVSAEGEQGGSFEGSLSGPFQGDPESETEIPELDWTASVSGEGGGQSIDFEGGAVVTEDNAFVEYNGEAYEVGVEQFGQLKEQFESQAEKAQQATAGEDTDAAASFKAGCEQALKQAGVSDTSGCDIDLSSWLTNLTDEGTEDVGGAESIHISGDADIDQILADVGEIASAIPGAAAQGFDPSQLSQLSEAVSEASIDVYSTVDEHLLSKLDLSLALDPSALAGDGVEIPIDSVDVDFSFEIADINEEQTIEAPADAQPIDQLLGDLGVNLDDLGGLPGAGGLPSSPGSNGGAGDADAYLECLEGATTPDAINECAKEL